MIRYTKMIQVVQNTKLFAGVVAVSFVIMCSLAFLQPSIQLYEPQVAPVTEQWNLGNIRKTEVPWTYEVPCAGAFKCFDTEAHARDAVEDLLQGYFLRYGINTVEQVISRYSPLVENPTEAIIDRVSDYLDVERDQELDMLDPVLIDNLANAIIIGEGNV